MKKVVNKIINAFIGQKNDTDKLLKKWMEHAEVREWAKKGWIDDKVDNVPFMLSQWEMRKQPIPPPHKVKEFIIQEYAKKYNFDTLIETGTYLGMMIEAQKSYFKKIISIELNEKFHADAVEKFKSYSHIHLYLGDSGKVLNDVVKELDRPALFWLDAHYCSNMSSKGDKECPIYEEVDAIFSTKKLNHVLLIDDARLFIGKNDYPTIPDLTNHVAKKNPSYSVSVKNDIIRFEILS